MQPEEFQQLAEKASAGTLSQQEELKLLQELNKGAEALQELIKIVKESENK